MAKAAPTSCAWSPTNPGKRARYACASQLVGVVVVVVPVMVVVVVVVVTVVLVTVVTVMVVVAIAVVVVVEGPGEHVPGWN